MLRTVRVTASGALIVSGLLLTALVDPAPILAHGGEVPPPLGLDTALTQWTVEPLALAALVLALALYLYGVRRVDRAHPANPVPRWQVASWVAGCLVLIVALSSSIDVYADTLFSVHMVQHMLIVFLGAPLLVLGAPVTLLLRAAPARARVRWIVPALHSRPLRALGHPVVTWLGFAFAMYYLHFGPVFDLALRDDTVHALEHVAFLATACLFWWPVAGVDPGPHRLSFPLRVGYTMLAMPLNGFLGLALFSASSVLYPTYLVDRPAWAPDALADQQLGGGLMWVAGDILFLIPLLLVVWAWFRAEEARGKVEDARLDRERAGGQPPRGEQVREPADP